MYQGKASGVVSGEDEDGEVQKYSDCGSGREVDKSNRNSVGQCYYWDGDGEMPGGSSTMLCSSRGDLTPTALPVTSLSTTLKTKINTTRRIILSFKDNDDKTDAGHGG